MEPLCASDRAEDERYAQLMQKYKESGLADFTDQEILELLLFHLQSKNNAPEAAKKLMDIYQYLFFAFSNLPKDLTEGGLISKQTALFFHMFPEMVRELKIRCKDPHPVLNTLQDTTNYLRDFFINRNIECFYMLCLDQENRVLSCNLLATGSTKQVTIGEKRIYSVLLQEKTTSVVVAHNHPRGIWNPSKPDLSMTRTLSHILRSNGVILRDHIIFTPTGSFSMVTNNVLPEGFYGNPYQPNPEDA